MFSVFRINRIRYTLTDIFTPKVRGCPIGFGIVPVGRCRRAELQECLCIRWIDPTTRGVMISSPMMGVISSNDDARRKPLWRKDLRRKRGRDFDVSACGTTTYDEYRLKTCAISKCCAKKRFSFPNFFLLTCRYLM